MARPSVRYWFLLILLLTVIPVMHLLPGLDGSTIERQIRDALHIVGFGAVAWLLFDIVPYRPVVRSLNAFIVAVVIGLLSEFGQKLTGNVFDPVDILRDAAGAGLMVMARMLWVVGTPEMPRLLLRCMALAAVLAVFAPMGYWSWVWLEERLKAPVIADFDGRFSETYVSATNSDVTLTSSSGLNDRHVRIVLTSSPRSGVLLWSAYYDWRSWEWFVFDAEIIDGKDAEVSIHINDYDSIDHFQDTHAGMITVTTGSSGHRVPIREIIRQAERGDDAGNIRQVAIFSRSRNPGTIMAVDNVRLE